MKKLPWRSLRKWLESPGGSALISAMVIGMVVTIMAVGYMQVASSVNSNEFQAMTSARAFHAAESGMRLGKIWLNSNYNHTLYLSEGAAISDIIPGLQINGMPLQVDVIKQATGVRIRCTARTAGALGYEKVVGQDAVLTTRPTPYPFEYAGFGKASVTMTGNSRLDSYNSNNGPYGGANVGSNGDVGTNGTGTGVISLSGNTVVFGDAGTGPGGTVTVSGNGQVTGSISDSTANDYPSVSVPGALTGLADNGIFSRAGNSSATINGGSYRYSSFSVTANAQVTINGNVTLYVTGDFSTAGNGKITIPAGSSLTLFIDGKLTLAGNGVVNNTSTPANFLVQSTYTGADDGVKIAGNGNLFGAVYAPDTEIKITGNGSTYGALISNKFSVSGNGNIHYDEALSTIGVSAGTTPTLDYISGTWSVQNIVP